MRLIFKTNVYGVYKRFKFTYTHASTHFCMHSHMHVRTRSCTYNHACTYIDSHQKFKLTHSRTLTHKRSQTNSYTLNTHSRTRTRTHAHTLKERLCLHAFHIYTMLELTIYSHKKCCNTSLRLVN